MQAYRKCFWGLVFFWGFWLPASATVGALSYQAEVPVPTSTVPDEGGMPQTDSGVIGEAPSSQDATSNTINLVVSGVSGLKDYTALLDYVHHLAGVIDVNSKQTQGDRVLLIVKTSSTLDGLAQVIASENKLIAQPLTGVDPAALVLSYRWVGNV